MTIHVAINRLGRMGTPVLPAGGNNNERDDVNHMIDIATLIARTL